MEKKSLLEKYSRQIQIAEAYVAKNFDGRTVGDRAKLTTAVLIENTNKFMTMTESFATQRTDLGDWKKFCLNLTNIAVPSLIANDLVIVQPMTSFSGSVAYLEYVAKSNKNGMLGKRLNSVFGFEPMDEERLNYTSQVVVETGAITLTPMVAGINKYHGEELVAGEDFMTVAPRYAFEAQQADAKVVKDGVAIYVTISGTEGAYTLTDVETNEAVELAEGDKIAYVATEFQMEHTPAKDIPTIGPKMKHIPLYAEPRRIAVRYDQITAFQAKTDYGFNLDKQIAEQACGELAYEIDSDIVSMLNNAAGAALDLLTWDRTQPHGVSKFEHFNGFLEVIEVAKQIMYERTQKFHPTYMVVAADVLPVIKFVNGFSAAKVSKMNGPYKVGELDGMNVYVSPMLKEGRFFLGVNGSDLMSSAGVYAPYMAIVPTQLLGTPDGGLAQGFSTYYAKAILNKNLLVAGKITGKVYGIQA